MTGAIWLPFTGDNLTCAACCVAGVEPLRYIDPRIAPVVPWDVMGDPRRFAFVCDGCAGDYDGRTA